MIRKFFSVLLVVAMLVSSIFATLPASANDIYALPTLDIDRDYYQTTFPTGLRYSENWNGTFSYVPNDIKVVLYDDTYSRDWGILLFSIPQGTKPPSGEQGGTSIKKLTLVEANNLLNTYSANALVKPFDAEITQVMEGDHFFIGAWAGKKLKQKWEYGTVASRASPVTARQIAYVNDSKKIDFSKVDLDKYDPDRYFVMGQVFVVDGTATVANDGRHVADTDLNVTSGVSQSFTIYMANGTTGTVADGVGCSIDAGSPQALAAGLNTLTVTGNGTLALDITIGTAANWNTVNSWSAASGGQCGASVPTNADNAYFDANSFTAANQVLTVNAIADCLDMNWTGTTNTPTLAGASSLSVSGSLTFIPAMTQTYSGVIYMVATAIGKTITCGQALAVTGLRFQGVGGGWTLQDAVDIGIQQLTLVNGTLDTNGQTITCGTFYSSYATARVLTLGASVFNCSAEWKCSNTTGMTLTANTSTINISNVAGGGDFDGGGLATYYNVNLNGIVHTVSGSNTFATLALPAGTTQTITFTDGTTQTATTFIFSGSAGHVHTLQGSGVGGWALSDAAGTNNYDYISVSRSTAGGGATFNGNGVSINGGNNVGWVFPSTLTTQAVTAITGQTAIGNGTITNGGGSPITERGICWDVNPLPTTADSTSTSAGTIGVFSVSITGLLPKAHYYARVYDVNGFGTSYGNQVEFYPDYQLPSSNLGGIVLPLVLLAVGLLLMLGLAFATETDFKNIFYIAIVIIILFALLVMMQPALNALL